ncbi:MAG TPA: type III-A CRISPR-associated RAMP protein Csm5 [Candidatus Anaerotignum merdipullorum]|nr:type III-A CRISPR-associated RAMP protein Csm5 [Candidatus Anaerotignum merdipullorum]
MRNLGHLQQFEMVLRARSPLFIGSGLTYHKHEYCYQSQKKTVSIIDQDAFFRLLIERNCIDVYEAFVLNQPKNLYAFLSHECRFSAEQIERITKYQVSAADALSENKPLQELHAFMRGANGDAYIPGSSLKGALRTILLCDLISREKKGSWPKGKNKKESSLRMGELEGAYFHTLSLQKKVSGEIKNDPVNSIMRGVSVSDSGVISDQQMILCQKIDVCPDGNQNRVNVCRECVKPGTEISFTVTLDQSVLKNTITASTILQTIQKYSHFYEEQFDSSFERPDGDAGISYENAIVLGGGSGYFSKTIPYVYLGAEKGLEETAEIMKWLFPRNSEKTGIHDFDVETGISPHMLKYTKYNGALYPYGVCEVMIR